MDWCAAPHVYCFARQPLKAAPRSRGTQQQLHTHALARAWFVMAGLMIVRTVNARQAISHPSLGAGWQLLSALFR